MTSSALESHGRFAIRYLFSTMTQSISPCAVGASIIAMGCFAATAIDFPPGRVRG